MDVAFATNFIASTGSPVFQLEKIAEAGFTHVHWCHHWNTDFLYGKHEIEQCRKWLKDIGLILTDIHGSEGQEKSWYSPVEYQRKAGVELVVNRIQMLDALGGSGVVVMHIPWYKTVTTVEQRPAIDACYSAVKRSLDELMPYCEQYNCAIAVENTVCDTFETISGILNGYPEKYVGLIYDSGHGNGHDRWTYDPPRPGDGLDQLEKWKHRLKAMHLHDNDSTGDQHRELFSGTIDWQRLAKILADSSYFTPGRDGSIRPISLEVLMPNTPYYDKTLKEQPESKVREFLADSFERSQRFAELVQTYRITKTN